MFADREDAGCRLVDLSDERGETAGLALVIPRDGLPVGREAADRLRAPFDVVTASKIGAPDNPELTMGVATGDGSAWWNEDLLSYLDVGEDYLGREREREVAAARDEVSLYRGGDPLPDMAEKRVVVIGDGVVMGATARACLRQVVAGGAERVVLAVPVGLPNTLSEFEAERDVAVVVESPEAFGVVGAFHRDFAQIPDEGAATYPRDGVGEH